MTDQANLVSRPWRRFLRFSVRGLIVIVLVIGGWLGWLVRGVRIQRDAVAAITKSGGSVKYDWEWKDGAPVPGARPDAPRWLVDLLGVDYFGHVTSVSYLSAVVDRTRARVAEVGARLSELQAKRKGAPERADGATATQEQQNKRLALVMSDGKTFGAKLDELDQLSHSEFNFTDDELVHLKWLTNLSDLNVSHTLISDTGLTHIEGLIKLERLDLSRTRITDAGLSRLRHLKNLSFLDLGWNPVTDSGLANLKVLTKLTVLELDGTHVTDAEMNDLERALPSLKIKR
jgi:hypothetical protein